MDIQQAVAENIHRIRKAQRLSIDRAAELSGVSKSMWGQIERGGANPTVSVLSRMAQGLHVPLEQLIACHDDPPTMLHRAVDVTGQRLCGGKVIAYRLFPFDPESRSESVQLDLFISGSYDGPDRVPGSWIYVTSLSGTVEVTTGGEAYRLESRDCLSFPGSQPYRYENVGNNTVRLIQWTVYKNETPRQIAEQLPGARCAPGSCLLISVFREALTPDPGGRPLRESPPAPGRHRPEGPPRRRSRRRLPQAPPAPPPRRAPAPPRSGDRRSGRYRRG